MKALPLHGIPFDLDAALSCGQVFRWNRDEDGGWRGIAGGRVLHVCQAGDTLLFDGADASFITRYFQLDLDLDAIIGSFNRDAVIEAAVAEHRGLRLIRQDPWECLLSFICAQNANIRFIRQMLEQMSRRCGEPAESGDEAVYAFPSPEALSALGEEGIRGCTCGYRSPYLYRTAAMVADHPGWADEIRETPYEDARRALMRFSGVGPKVADCILLFSFEMFEAFPVDVWIRRIMHRCYGIGNSSRPLSGKEYDRIRQFGMEYFGPWAGYAQEYLFMYHRSLSMQP
jgi:N-glycosylase/DNA lyase